MYTYQSIVVTKLLAGYVVSIYTGDTVTEELPYLFSSSRRARIFAKQYLKEKCHD